MGMILALAEESNDFNDPTINAVAWGVIITGILLAIIFVYLFFIRGERTMQNILGLLDLRLRRITVKCYECGRFITSMVPSNQFTKEEKRSGVCYRDLCQWCEHRLIQEYDHESEEIT